MTYGKAIRIALFGTLVVLAAGIYILSERHQLVERWYSSGLFPPLAVALRFTLGSIPFSLGDLLYAGVLLYVCRELFLFVRMLLQKTGWRQALVPLQKAALLLLFVYVYFYLFWGLNYYRLGIAHQLSLRPTAFSQSELQVLTTRLLKKANQTRAACEASNDTIMLPQRMFTAAQAGYRNLHRVYPFIRYQHPSLKPSLFGRLGNYVGFQGYYNPFTGEGQINTRIPNFVQPFVTCHEMAHQLGYASESEANFVGFLAAVHSADTLMMYSSYLDMFLYAWGNLRLTDSVMAGKITPLISEGVKRDIRTLQQFSRKHRTFLQDWTDRLYDFYLRRNRQKNGIQSYTEVTAWLIGYSKKFPADWL